MRVLTARCGPREWRAPDQRPSDAQTEFAFARWTKYPGLRCLAIRRGEGSGVDRIGHRATRVLGRGIAAPRPADELVRGRIVNTFAAHKAALVHYRNVVGTELVRGSTEAGKRNQRPCRRKAAGTDRISADTAGIARHLRVTGIAGHRRFHLARAERKRAENRQRDPAVSIPPLWVRARHRTVTQLTAWRRSARDYGPSGTLSGVAIAAPRVVDVCPAAITAVAAA